MNVFLLHQDRDFVPTLPWNAEALTDDLELDTLFDAMALGDDFIRDVASNVVLSSLIDTTSIVYRQDILKDCLSHPAMVRSMYRIAVDAIEGERKSYLGFFARGSPTSLVNASREMLGLFTSQLKKLRATADAYADDVASQGLQRLFAAFRSELDDSYLARVEAHLKALRFRGGVLISAGLGPGNGGVKYVLRQPKRGRWSVIDLMASGLPSVYTFHLDARDVSGGEVLSTMRDRALNQVANALAQSKDHIRSFFAMLRTELAFYVGCLNLHDRLVELGQRVCFPVPVAPGERAHSFVGLYDACLALTMGRGVVGNDLHADHLELAVITGANQGGKSTFLRSLGLAQLMLQCGMFVPAESFRASVCTGLYTHFKRGEDAAMERGKLDEECSRMSDIADHLTANGVVLFNESFAATNEREGSEIASQIVHALLDSRIKVFFVTHLYELAAGLYRQGMTHAVFLRAERKADGTRTFRIVEGEPQQTSYGEDLYARIFGAQTGDGPPAWIG
jgi:DNA mismatch repair ATPase MutS